MRPPPPHVPSQMPMTGSLRWGRMSNRCWVPGSKTHRGAFYRSAPRGARRSDEAIARLGRAPGLAAFAWRLRDFLRRGWPATPSDQRGIAQRGHEFGKLGPGKTRPPRHTDGRRACGTAAGHSCMRGVGYAQVGASRRRIISQKVVVALQATHCRTTLPSSSFWSNIGKGTTGRWTSPLRACVGS